MPADAQHFDEQDAGEEGGVLEQPPGGPGGEDRRLLQEAAGGGGGARVGRARPGDDAGLADEGVGVGERVGGCGVGEGIGQFFGERFGEGCVDCCGEGRFRPEGGIAEIRAKGAMS
ncbi:hypothetical protein [Streptomyces sp. NPDC019539]|uniref:hypothetical protein n=1 Tax=Streptomyces sp. NPDC019539 TaxID=3365063 RepID=UPI0037AFF0B7